MKKTVLINVTNTMPERDPRWGGYVTGIGYAAKCLVDALSRIEDNPYNIELYASGKRALNFDFYGWNFKHHRIVPDRFATILRPLILKYSLFHLPEHIFNVAKREPFIVTIHDCTDMDPQFSIDLTEQERESVMRRYQEMANKSRLIVTDSISSKEEITKFLGVSSDKIVVNYLGIDRTRFKVLSKNRVQQVLDKFTIQHPYFFACSCNRPRKNLITALRAYKSFLTYHPNHIFVVAWSNPFPSIKEEFAKEIAEGRIVFLPFLSDEELVALYNGATMSVYVSRKEGFGMPILESFACGTPVMTCRNSSLPEVGQDAAIYVGEDAIDEMVDVMKLFEFNSYNSSQFEILSKEVLDQFSWDATARRCISIYDRCI